MFAIPNVAVLTTMKINPTTNKYYRPEDADALRLAKESNIFLKVPLLYHERQTNNKLESSIFLQNNDNTDNIETVKSKINVLFPESGGHMNTVVLYVHGFNNSVEGAKRDAEIIHTVTKHPVVVFGWDSTHDLSILPVFGDILPGVAQGYAKDSEMVTTSVRPLNWILYVLLRGSNRVNIISHSMGTRIVLGSINSLSHDYWLTTQNNSNKTQTDMLNRFGSIVFKEPDVDILNTNRCIMNDLSIINGVNNNVHLYVYVHERDSVLGLSRKIHYNIQRVGQLCGAAQLLEVLNPNTPRYLHIINATSCEGRQLFGLYVNPFADNSNHSYWQYKQFQLSLKYVINNSASKSLPSVSIGPILNAMETR